MGTQSEWVYTDLQTPKTVKTAHKISLVSPRMDVDVTGVALKNVRTHLIDHPRDDGLRQREQLWNFQQRYRGALGKVRLSSGIGYEERKCETSGSDEQQEVPEDDFRQNESLKSRFTGDQSSLPSRFRKRLRQRVNYGLRSTDFFTDSEKSRSLPSREQREDEKSNPGIQRMYSSGLMVKNNLYNQIRGGSVDSQKVEQIGDNSRILEAIQKYGSLERLPDISYPGLKSSQTPNIRFLRTVNSYNKRLIEQGSERRLISLRRSFTNIGDLVSSKRKLIIVSRRHNDERLIKLGYVDQYNEEGEGDGNDEDDDIDDIREDGENQDDQDDECDNENQVTNTEQLHRRDCDQKNPEHLNIRDNITPMTSQDDTVLFERHRHEGEIFQRNGLRAENTFHVDTRKTSDENRREYRRTDLAPQEPYMPKSNRQIKESWNQTKVGTNSVEPKQEKEEVKVRVVPSKRSQKKNKDKVDKSDKEEESESSDDSLDIPDDKFGPTTHSIDKKLAIRKPWEWKPSPYRWIDKPYIRESDKPYIERIINKGEVIDEYHYDSFARTRPLKVQNFPEGAGYKDRYGVLR